MKIAFRPARLALIRTKRAHELGLPIGVVKSARNKIIVMEAAPDERTLRNWKSLEYKTLTGKLKGLRQIRINDQYRIRFELDLSTSPPTATIVDIGDPH
jgi:proteic killer suppression protein